MRRAAGRQCGCREGAGAGGAAAFFSRRPGSGWGGALRPAGAASFAGGGGGRRDAARPRAGAFTSALLRRARSRRLRGAGDEGGEQRLKPARRQRP